MPIKLQGLNSNNPTVIRTRCFYPCNTYPSQHALVTACEQRDMHTKAQIAY